MRLQVHPPVYRKTPVKKLEVRAFCSPIPAVVQGICLGNTCQCQWQIHQWENRVQEKCSFTFGILSSTHDTGIPSFPKWITNWNREIHLIRNLLNTYRTGVLCLKICCVFQYPCWCWYKGQLKLHDKGKLGLWHSYLLIGLIILQLPQLKCCFLLVHHVYWAI